MTVIYDENLNGAMFESLNDALDWLESNYVECQCYELVVTNPDGFTHSHYVWYQFLVVKTV